MCVSGKCCEQGKKANKSSLHTHSQNRCDVAWDFSRLFEQATKEKMMKQKKKLSDFMVMLLLLHPKQTLDLPLSCKYLWKKKLTYNSMEFLFFYVHLNRKCICIRVNAVVFVIKLLKNHHIDKIWMTCYFVK